jgi:hypothetical protein
MQTPAAPGMAGQSIDTADNAKAPDAARMDTAAGPVTTPAMIPHCWFHSKKHFDAWL